MRGSRPTPSPQMQRYGGQQPRNMMQMDNRARNRELQARRSAGRSAAGPMPNLYNPGADTATVGAVQGNQIGLGGNDYYLLHQLQNGGFVANRGNLDPTRINLSGDYSRLIR